MIKKYCIVDDIHLHQYPQDCSEVKWISVKGSTSATKSHTKQELNIELQISGLEAEKRMIQATDRKLFDVRRQTEIEDEIKKLKSQRK